MKPLPIVMICITLLVAAAIGADHFFRGDIFLATDVATPDLTLFGASAALGTASSTPTEVGLPPQLPVNTTSVAGGKRVAHEQFGFELTVPEKMQIERFQEGSGAETLVFFDPDTSKEFQMFVVPYTQSQITQERMAQDIKSGVVKNMQEVVLPNQMHATIFESEVPGIGATREVWFIHNGHLFEFTVSLQWDAWLSQILNTWKSS